MTGVQTCALPICEVFEGTIAGVTAFGVFVALDGVYVEGLVHVTELGNDYFNFDKARHEMLGERTGARFRLGDRLTVKVARVDLETSKIDFTLVSNAKTIGLQTNTSAAAGDAHKNKLGINREKSNTDFKPLSTRALDRAKKDRTGGKKLGKSAPKSGTKSSINSSPPSHSKSRDRNTKNKGKR